MMINNEHVVVMRASRLLESSFMITWAFSLELTFEHGMKIFLSLLQQDSGYVNPPSILGNRVRICRPVRPGGSCRAFTAEYTERDVIAKLYTEETTAQEDAYKLSRVAGILPDDDASFAKIPSLLGQEGPWLLLSPVGRRFTPETFRLHHLRKLLDTLRIVHEANIIHRDVRFANILLLPNDQVLLNDWGASADAGFMELAAGCPPPFCHEDLVNVADAIPEPKHDLHSLIMSTAYLILPGVDAKQHFPRLVADALDAAKNQDYDGVLRAFEESFL